MLYHEIKQIKNNNLTIFNSWFIVFNLKRASLKRKTITVVYQKLMFTNDIKLSQ